MRLSTESSKESINIAALEKLEQYFGYSEFRGQQLEIITEVVKGHDALVLMPTGGGKSLCYQIPALLLPGCAIVVSPLIALMQDQVVTLQQAGVRAEFLNSSQDSSRQKSVINALRSSELDLLYVSPERLINQYTLQLLQQCEINLFAIDEAHCVSQWGHDFRSDYLALSELVHHFPNVPRIALTATADERTQQEISQRLSLLKARRFIDNFDRPNIQYRITQKTNARQQLLAFIRNEHHGDSGIIYCMSRKKVEDTAAWLDKQGVTALPYHAGLPNSLRANHQTRFLNEDNIIIVATVAFGMGIDKPDVRFVAHLDLPKSIEAYYQETGRAGRDGLPSTAWMVYGINDVIKLKQLMAKSEGSQQHKRMEQHKLNAMLGLCEISSCRRHMLLTYFAQTSPEQCGNCDACLTPQPQWDATIASQKALSCVYRSGQRFGVNHLIDILRGSNCERIKQFSHDKISTYGIGKELDTHSWRSVFRQLIARAYLHVDVEGYGGLQLTDKSRPLLRGDESIMLRKDIAEVVDKERKKSKANKHNIAADQQELWQALRACRKQLADENNVPPYVIFHDATLMQMMDCHPITDAEFLNISGIGESKLERFGRQFLAILNNHDPRHAQGFDNHRVESQEILALFFAGFDVMAICQQRSVEALLVYKHLSRAIERGDTPVTEVTGLSENEISTIEDVLLSQEGFDEPSFSFNRAMKDLGGLYELGQLHCVRAHILAPSV